MKISVIICTHNPRLDYLQRVLSALQSQTLPKSDWELLVIDNQSTEFLEKRVDLAWHPCGRVVREEKLGLALARLCGIAQSHGEILVFVDDDNVLAADYLSECRRIAQDWPQLGVWGGSIVPELEVQPRADLLPHLQYLALREVTQPRWSNVWDCKDAEPWGAGLCVRRPAALAYQRYYHQESHLLICGRAGTSLLSGEDSELCFVVCGMGLGMGLFPSLKVLHLIPKRRLTETYLARIAEGLETSSWLLFFKWAGRHPGPPFSPLSLLRLLKHFLLDRGIERRLYLAKYRGRLAAARIIRASDQKSRNSDSGSKNNLLRKAL
jgi:glycosyltransferase involved in cell wall biosynthesis